MKNIARLVGIIVTAVGMVFVMTSFGGGANDTIRFTIWNPDDPVSLYIQFDPSNNSSEYDDKVDAINSLTLADFVFTPGDYVTAVSVQHDDHDHSVYIKITKKATGTTKVTVKPKDGFTFVCYEGNNEFTVTAGR